MMPTFAVSFTINGANPASVLISLAQLDNRYYQSAELPFKSWLSLRFKLIRVSDNQVLYDSATRQADLTGRDGVIWQESDGPLNPGNYAVHLVSPCLLL